MSVPPGLAYAGGAPVRGLAPLAAACEELLRPPPGPSRAAPMRAPAGDAATGLALVLSAALASSDRTLKACVALAGGIQRSGLLGNDEQSPLRVLLRTCLGERGRALDGARAQIVYLGNPDVTSADRVMWKFPAQQFSPSIEMIPRTLGRLAPG